MSAVLTVILATITSAATAYLAHRASLAHFHLLGAIPVGGVIIGIGAAIGVALSLRLTAGYDTAGARIFAQLGGASAYAGAMLLDFVTYEARGGAVAAGSDPTNILNYIKMLVEQGAAAILAQIPWNVTLPGGMAAWLGMVRLLIEVLGAIVATGWTVSYLAGVPFCWRNRRFYDLKHLVESSNVSAVREWEMAINQRRPIEARALLARVRAGRVSPVDRAWMRIAVHQCPICQAARVRFEKRRRTRIGRIHTERADEMQFDAVKGSALLAT